MNHQFLACLVFSSCLFGIVLAGHHWKRENNQIDLDGDGVKRSPQEVAAQLSYRLEREYFLEYHEDYKELLEMSRIDYSKCNQREYFDKFCDYAKRADGWKGSTRDYIDSTRQAQFHYCKPIFDQNLTQIVANIPALFQGTIYDFVDKLIRQQQREFSSGLFDKPHIQRPYAATTLVLTTAISDKSLTNLISKFNKRLSSQDQKIEEVCQAIDEQLSDFVDFFDKQLRIRKGIYKGNNKLPASQLMWDWITNARVCRMVLGKRDSLVDQERLYFDPYRFFY